MKSTHNPFDPGYFTSAELRQFGFARVGENCIVARNCTILGLENIVLGDDVRIDGYTTLIAVKGWINIGSHVHICSGCVIGARGGVDLGSFSSLSHGTKLLSAVDDFSGNRMTNSTLPEKVLDVWTAPISIGRHVPIGSGALILPGTTVGEGAAIQPMAIVTGTLPEWMVCGGNPARPLQRRSNQLLDHAAKLSHDTPN